MLRSENLCKGKEMYSKCYTNIERAAYPPLHAHAVGIEVVMCGRDHRLVHGWQPRPTAEPSSSSHTDTIPGRSQVHQAVPRCSYVTLSHVPPALMVSTPARSQIRVIPAYTHIAPPYPSCICQAGLSTPRMGIRSTSLNAETCPPCM